MSDTTAEQILDEIQVLMGSLEEWKMCEPDKFPESSFAKLIELRTLVEEAK